MVGAYFSHASLCSIKYAVVKTLIEKKTAQYPNRNAPLPNLGNLPQVGNRCLAPSGGSDASILLGPLVNIL